VSPRRIVVLGGGIAGLSAAYHLAEARRGGALVDCHLAEASARLGGALRTERIEGCLVEAGGDSMLTEKSEALELCERLGLGGQLTGSLDAGRRTWLLHRGRLVGLPEGFELLVPTRLWAVARTPLLSLSDKLALATEAFRSFAPLSEDESVAQFVERHFSRGVLESIVDPLLAAIYGGDVDELSAAAVLPWLTSLERQHGSLVRGARALARQRGRAGAPRKPLFTTLGEGMDALVGALRDRLAPGRVSCGQRAVELARLPDGYRVTFEGGRTEEAEAVVLALPAYESARLLRPLDAALAAALEEIPYSSSVIVALAYEQRRVGALPAGFGFLVPAKERRRLVACTFVNQKYPGRAPEGRILLRCFLGGRRDQGALELSDTEALGIVRRELTEILGLAAEPLFARVYRWPRALAQYTVGHARRLSTIRQRLGEHPGLFLCGNAYQGIGIPDCIRSGREAAEGCLKQLGGQ